jgi:hypothetical protein
MLDPTGNTSLKEKHRNRKKNPSRHQELEDTKSRNNETVDTAKMLSRIFATIFSAV